ncbi:hypothetical protein D9613_000655 [Agrocybe pediades]|uniref:Cytochrome b561 domain-containing protein n=1 Tax=Agrocybe pediades TaxID=84607 RepID=A0A8H4R0S4_9AGAR|nr:hypothetical protein D9613_000655 [Agrocybe pediades]
MHFIRLPPGTSFSRETPNALRSHCKWKFDYILNRQPLGWMAMGFGSQMTGSPMVIMWINSDNHITISQRKAPAEVMPTVDPNPPRTAVLDLASSKTSSSAPELAFTVPSNNDGVQSIIWAFGTTNPGDSSPSAVLVQHADSGTLNLDLTKQLSGNTTAPPTDGTPTGGSFKIPYLPYQKLIIAHAVFCSVGFLVLLPLGALLARYLRTFIPTWFKGHWIVQFVLAGPVIVIGVSLGIAAVAKAKAFHLDDDHKRWGIAIFILYFVQCGLGAFIHFVKKSNRKHRPPQNYMHAIIGLAIIGLALYQVHSGYDHEWPTTTGRGQVPSGVNIAFWVWVALLPASYGLGLFFLPKQYKQEYARVRTQDEDSEEVNRMSLEETQYQKPHHASGH